MKKVAYFIVFITLYSCCTNTPSDVDKAVEKERINKVLNQWHKSASEADFDAYFDAMSTTSVFIGTDASENWNNTAFKKFSKPYFDRGKAWSFKTIERTIYLNDEGDFAWFDELLDTHMGICRGSGVLKKDTEWKIEHYVLSLTIPNEVIDEVKKITKKRDSIFLAKKLLRN